MPRDDRHLPNTHRADPVIVIGAGIAGLAAALRLVAAGLPVHLLERAATIGGKIRTVPSMAGPVDAGPTVLTMRAVFDDLFAAAGLRLDDHVTLMRQDILARHHWPDGTTLDLFDDPERSEAAISCFAGPKAAAEYRRFMRRTSRLFDAFDAPMMQAADPSTTALALTVARDPALLSAMAPLRCMAGQLTREFSDPRLRQLFGRYATYVGGSPHLAPALLNLVCQSEARGVWTVRGGMHALAKAIAQSFQAQGGTLTTAADVRRIETHAGAACAVHLGDGRRLSCSTVLFAGDPRALPIGALGPDVARAIPDISNAPRSHSAQVWSFAATPKGPLARTLVHHNICFAADARSEFDDLAAGRVPREPSLYICAQDRGTGSAPKGPERFEIILNAPPVLGPGDTTAEDRSQCHSTTFQTLDRMGLSFDPAPGPDQLSTPQTFTNLFPGSLGSLYGQSPHGMTASLKRPRARTRIRGLYLAGGGCHPGAGVPMATLSGKHAVEAIMRDRISISKSLPMAMPGGMSTA